MIDKITLNIGTGEPGDKLDKAMKLLDKISGAKSIQTKSKRRIPTWNIRPGLPIGCMVTLRGEKAEKLLHSLFSAVDNNLKRSSFDDFGNFSFGIKEYLDIPNVGYDVSIGIIGLEVAVTLKRKGFRVKERRLKRGKIGRAHLISKEDAINFIGSKFKVGVK